MPTHAIRLRECGLTSPRFRELLNVRCIVIKRELRDATAQYDERVVPLKAAYESWIEADNAHIHHEPANIIKLRDDAYNDAMGKLQIAIKQRNRRVQNLKTNLALVRAALRACK